MIRNWLVCNFHSFLLKETPTIYFVQVIALDQRGHGDTVTSNDTDLAAPTLVQDVVNVWSVLNGEDRNVLTNLI